MTVEQVTVEQAAMPEQPALSDKERVLLGQVANRKVCFVQGCYRLVERGSRAVGPEIQLLRARMLVRLETAVPGQRIAPTRMAELTSAGELLWAQLSEQRGGGHDAAK